MWHSFVAIGDSFTEGLADETDVNGRHRGWADRLAHELSSQSSEFRYANLAVRGKLLSEIRREQAPIAAAMGADLVSIAGGVNDAMRRRFNVHRSATSLEESVRLIRGAGSEVLLFAFGDPARRSGVLSTLQRRLWELNSATRAIAHAHGCFLVDFWGVAAFDDDAVWDEDRLHLAPAGHQMVTGAVLEALGMGDASWRTPGRYDVPALPVRARSNLRWTTHHGLPWLGRRVRGLSSGAGIQPKRPALARYPRSAG
jgi:lysophospholipase L1-like esterase